MLPLVIHSGRCRWRAPLRLETLFVSVPEQIKRHLPRLTYLLLDERSLDLDRPELSGNPTAAFFQIETNERAESLPGLYQQLKTRIPPGDLALRHTLNAWFAGVVQRTVPNAIIPDGVNLEEAPMLEENLILWSEKIRKEAWRAALKEGRREGGVLSLQEMLLQQMTLRFGRLPAKVRRQVEEISSLQELRKLGRKVLRAKSLEAMGLG